MIPRNIYLVDKITNDSLPDARPGAYALLLRITTANSVTIGQRYQLPLAPGWMVYVGSALGPGGVRARLAHHRRLADRPHWHIDYLRQYATLEAIWFSHDPSRRECLWAAVLIKELGGSPPLFRFGASDCRCPAHLYGFPDGPYWLRSPLRCKPAVPTTR